MADAVLIEIAPDTQVSESAVGRIHLAVAVVIEFFQCLIAVGGALAVFEQGVVTEQFAAVIDDAVAIAVMDEQTVVLADPTGGSADAVLVMVKECAFMPVASEGFNTVAVKVQGEGVVLADEHFAIKIHPVLSDIGINGFCSIPIRRNRWGFWIFIIFIFP